MIAAYVTGMPRESNYMGRGEVILLSYSKEKEEEI